MLGMLVKKYFDAPFDVMHKIISEEECKKMKNKEQYLKQLNTK